MEKLTHKITHTEIKYGIITITKKEYRFYDKFGERFDVMFGNDIVYSRCISADKIWMGKSIMRMFNPNDIVNLEKKGPNIIINKKLKF